jgi:hypothetical protein
MVTATNTEGATASASQTIALTVTSEPPKLSVVIGGIGEPGPDNQSSNLGWCFVTPVDTSDTVSLTIAGLPAGATVSATDINGNFISQGTDNHDGSWTLTESQAFEVNPGPPLFPEGDLAVGHGVGGPDADGDGDHHHGRPDTLDAVLLSVRPERCQNANSDG